MDADNQGPERTAISAGWHPDPLGRHDFRLWAAGNWTEHVADGQIQSKDPLPTPPPTTEPILIRPSAELYGKLIRQPWRWVVFLGAMAFLILICYSAAGWPLAGLVVGGVVLLLFVYTPLVFKVSYVRADPKGLEVRSAFGRRRQIPRSRISSISVGRTWAGGLHAPDQAIVVSNRGELLARYYLSYWRADDFERIAGALGLRLYGRPGRSLDSFHSGRSAERAARTLVTSVGIGAGIGCLLPLAFIVAIAIAVLLKHA